MLAACSPHARQLTAHPAAGSSGTSPSARSAAAPATSARARPVTLGAAGTFRVGRRQLTFTEPARTGPSGAALGLRTLITQLWYPAGPAVARGPFPLLLFAPGFPAVRRPFLVTAQ